MPTEAESLESAVSRIESGSSVAAGLALEHAIPFATGHELLRQETEDLTMIGPISDLLFDQLIGGGAVSAVRAAWVGNVSAGTGYQFRQAVENGLIDVENHSNFSIALGLKAAALGVPYLPTQTLLGSDIFEESDLFLEETDPFSGEQVALVPAISPDWTIVHAQRASPEGDVHLWGNTGIVDPAVGAAENVLVTAEEIVDPGVIKSDPSRVAITREQVTSVVECPFGAHPSPVAGHYNRDNEYYLEYSRRTETDEEFEAWADEWVYSVENREAYADLVETDLAITDRTVAAEVEYGQ